MKEIQLYANILEWLFVHDSDENRDAICYETFRDKVKDEKELRDFIKNFRDL